MVASGLSKHWSKLYKKQDPVKHTWSQNPSSFIFSRVNNLAKEGFTTVLDIGCGDGRDLVSFLQAGFRGAGVDVSLEALKRAKSNFKSLSFDKFDLFHGDVSSVELSEKYDVMISAKVFKHMWNTEEVVENLVQYLSDNGVVIFEFASLKDSSHRKCKKNGENRGGYKYLFANGTPYRFHSREELERIFKPYFREIKIEKHLYWDDPHVELSTGRHLHTSWVVVARK